MRLPEAVVAMGVTGEFPEEGPYYDVISPVDLDMHLQPDPRTVRIVPWAVDPTAQVIHDCYTKTGQLVPFAPRSVLRRVCDLYAAEGWDPVVAPELEFYLVARNTDPDVPLKPPHRPQRPRRDLAPGLFHRRGQRVRPAVRRHVLLLRADGAERRHADPRGRRRADGDQLLPRPPAGAGRRGVLLQAHGARGGAAARHVRHLHGQAHCRRAGQRHAHAPERGGHQDPAQHLQQRGRHASARSSTGTSAACSATSRRRWRCSRPTSTRTAAWRATWPRRSTSSGAPTTAPWASARPSRCPRRGAWRTASSAPTPTPTWRWPPRWPAATWA